MSADLIVGIIAETMLIKEKHGTKFGWTISPFKPYLTKGKALIVGAIQMGFTFFVPFFYLTNTMANVFCSFHSIIIPISIIIWKTLYLTTIREPWTGRYNFKWYEWIIAIAIYLGAAIWIYFAATISLTSIYDPASYYCTQIGNTTKP